MNWSKKINRIGKILIGIGVLFLFKKIEGFNGIGGYINNTWEILLGSMTFMSIGVILILVNKVIKKRN